MGIPGNSEVADTIALDNSSGDHALGYTSGFEAHDFRLDLRPRVGFLVVHPNFMHSPNTPHHLRGWQPRALGERRAEAFCDVAGGLKGGDGVSCERKVRGFAVNHAYDRCRSLGS